MIRNQELWTTTVKIFWPSWFATRSGPFVFGISRKFRDTCWGYLTDRFKIGVGWRNFPSQKPALGKQLREDVIKEIQQRCSSWNSAVQFRILSAVNIRLYFQWNAWISDGSISKSIAKNFEWQTDGDRLGIQGQNCQHRADNESQTSHAGCRFNILNHCGITWVIWHLP